MYSFDDYEQKAHDRLDDHEQFVTSYVPIDHRVAMALTTAFIVLLIVAFHMAV